MLPDVFGPANRMRCVAQLERLPSYKRFKSSKIVSAVLIPLCLVQNIPSVLFVKRPMKMRRNPGEVGFPGGKCDPEDEGDVVRTALRETQEEIGLDPNSVDIWCVMPRVDARVTIYPVLGFCGRIDLPQLSQSSSSDSLNINTEEVSDVFVRSIDWLTHPDTLRYTQMRLDATYFLAPAREGRATEIPRAAHGSFAPAHQLRLSLPAFGAHPPAGFVEPRIWGATGFILYQMLRALVPLDSRLPAAVHSRLSNPANS
ncbi:nudix (nucleoside diphosphate linked moiety X)-type motif 8 [Clonorchis sinensis]|uniref:Nudix (Nucleoside diphosphate linked moiety X)-type motif 8 n=1 Tax=Clonorchis sinensis TaxID=79923 RepID=A0A3R7JS25_CLOSI|nr:nudix (nucleoside diphosphate linked moiety X)-type motif 8 [Clonorchis sinensis]